MRKLACTEKKTVIFFHFCNKFLTLSVHELFDMSLQFVIMSLVILLEMHYVHLQWNQKKRLAVVTI